ncbi:MAG: threonine--tRNA ligase [Hyphomicrobiales bacterium]|nr:threonine--tRNA ligase [Hyphomicrobiales bacterium]
MITLRLPDGAEKKLDAPIRADEFARSIAPSLAKRALAVRIDGELRDLSTVLDGDSAIEFLMRDHPDALELLRHDAAHVLAEAVQELYPGTQVTIGPVIEHGFYYDFARDEPFHPEDLEKIEARMHEIVKRNETITREVWNRADAIEHFRGIGEHYKAEIIKDLPEDEVITIYRQGEWLDLCRGPHLPSTGKLGKAFKLLRLAGAYWRGDSSNPMLQRIYGTAWAEPSQLKDYLHMLEEARKRDHRRIGKDMGLFHMQEEAAGMVFWHRDGWTLYRELESYMRRKLAEGGYFEVKTPQLVDRKLWESSGHWDKFREHMYVTESEERHLALKPMNCPCHVQLFNQGTTSYRDLPLRMAEFGACHRYEPSGALHGLMRVRGFVQDDAHIFCTEGQINSETKRFCALLEEIYGELGFKDIHIMYADRPEKRIGEDALWDYAEKALEQAVQATGLPYDSNPGEGAFYGPKLEFNLRDAIGRSWQCGTFQVDFNLPKVLGATYIGEDGARHVPVMLHRAILGSMERFIGILIEHYEGRFPFWLAPVQLVVATITNRADAYAEEVAGVLREAGLRVETDIRNEKINYKVREHSHGKVPAILVVGDKEAESREVSLRRLGSKEQTSLTLDEAVETFVQEALPPDLRPRS